MNLVFYQIYRFRNCTNYSLRLKLVNALVLSKLDYCLIASMGVSKELDLKLQRIINRCVRYVVGLPWDSRITEARRNLNWLSLSDRRHFYALSLLYQISNTGEPSYLSSLFIEPQSSRILRHNQRTKLFTIPFVKTDQFKNSFVIKTIRLWNALPEEIVNSSTIQIFKNKIRQYLFNSQFPS